jgi:hypothetical protein
MSSLSIHHEPRLPAPAPSGLVRLAGKAGWRSIALGSHNRGGLRLVLEGEADR